MGDSRVWRTILAGTAAAGLLLLLAVGWFALGEAPLHWAISRIEAQSQGRISVDGARRTGVGAFEAVRLRYADADLEVRVDQPRFVLVWSGLLRGEPVVERVEAVRVRVVSGSAPAGLPSRPESLASRVPFDL